MRDVLCAEGTIGAEDLDRLVLTDSIEEIVAELMQCPFKVFEKIPLPRRRWWLWEGEELAQLSRPSQETAH